MYSVGQLSRATYSWRAFMAMAAGAREQVIDMD
jgi:hypothetical protein